MVRTKKQAKSQADNGDAEFSKANASQDLAAKRYKIQAAFPGLSTDAVTLMLLDCASNEDEVISRLTHRQGYLQGIQRILLAQQKTQSAQPSPPPSLPAPQTPLPSPILAPACPEPAMPQCGSSQPPCPPQSPIPTTPTPSLGHPTAQANTTTSPQALPTPSLSKKKMTGRLALDDAIKQIQNQPENGMEGWSQARIRAFQMIEQNPNSYYYRFNAPGQEQRKGPWTAEEQQLFFDRLKTMGANGQWGIFSMTIPGRVGYQCSNYYRLLIESGQLHDPNYVVDEKGKAHFLFDKRSADGRVEKTFRTHSKHQMDKKPKKPARRPKDDDEFIPQRVTRASIRRQREALHT